MYNVDKNFAASVAEIMNRQQFFYDIGLFYLYSAKI